MIVRGSSYITCLLSISICLFSTREIDGFAAFGVRSGGVRRSSTLSMSSALIVQNKGGGHGELGFQLCKKILSNPKISSITILQDDACKDSKQPFASYSSDLPSVRVVKAPLSSDDSASMTASTLQSLLGENESYDYVWDNASKGPVGAGKAVCDCAKIWGTKIFTYVSSAGMYQPPPEGPFPMPESTAVKSSSGQNQLEQYAVEQGLPLVSFRPQYIYGPKANKFDYIDWYFDRLARDLPLPIPGDGTQKVSLTNAEDVASLLACVLEKPEAAIEQRFFNCGTDELYSYDEVGYMCAEAMGLNRDQCQIEHYDGKLFGKAKFPFRLTNFYVAPDKAKEVLGWEGPKNSLAHDLKWYYEGFLARGGVQNKIDLWKDWEIVVGCKTNWSNGSIYDKWNPLEIDVSNVKPVCMEGQDLEELMKDQEEFRASGEIEEFSLGD